MTVHLQALSEPACKSLSNVCKEKNVTWGRTKMHQQKSHSELPWGPALIV